MQSRYDNLELRRFISADGLFESGHEVLGNDLVKYTKITYLNIDNEDYISLTDMLKSKDGDFFISDWLRNRNTIEFLGI